MLTRHFLVAALLATTAPLAFSHGAWIAERVGEPTIIYGHGDADDSYNPEKIVFVQGFDHDGNPIDVALNKSEKNATLDGDADFHTIALVLDNGYWSQDANGKWINKPKNEVDGAQKGGHYIKDALNIQEPGKLPSLEALKPLALVIIPEGDVTKTHEGDSLPVTVYFEGKPLADAEIVGDYVNSGKVVAKTDANGKANVPVRNQGLNVIAVDHETAPADDEKEKADKVGYNSTLSFTNAHHDH